MDMKTLIATAAMALSIIEPALAAEPELKITRAGARPVSAAPAQNFIGAVKVEMLYAPVGSERASAGTVSFAPGARTAWHSHPLGQTLVVTAGIGRVQRWGGAVEQIRAGDVVHIPANVKHWHGAAVDSAMTHIAITEALDGKAVEWLEQVSDSDDLAAVASASRSAGSAESVQAPARAWPTSDALSAKQRAIPLIAASMAASDMPKLNTALNQGLDAGMTISEAKEVLVQLYAYAGFPRSLNALGGLMKVVEARQQRGIQDDSGREPGRTVATGDELIAAGRANQSEISGGPVRGAVFDFAPVINQFLQAHLFGDIFERDNLDWQSRELATVGALAATPGTEAQLRSHMRASLRVGLTAAQLRQLVGLLAEHVDAGAAKRADEALTQSLTAASNG